MKVVRSVCYFTQNVPTESTVSRVKQITDRLQSNGFEVQTRRICSPSILPSLTKHEKLLTELDSELFLSCGSLDVLPSSQLMEDFYATQNVAFNLNLTNKTIDNNIVSVLFDIIKCKPQHTFRFCYTFGNGLSTPYFPSASYEKDGFAIGLQPTNLAEGCKSIEEWLHKMKGAWGNICELFKEDEDFLGIDSSIAPLFSGHSSFLYFVKNLGYSFERSVTTDIYLTITKFIKEQNPKPVGLCGLMFPCAEDFELADEYGNNGFSLERNIFLSLHSGVGIDVYPIGIDEEPSRVVEILKTVQGLSAKHNKPLSVRFVSDGKAKIGQKTDFKNQYLKDVVIRPL